MPLFSLSTSSKAKRSPNKLRKAPPEHVLRSFARSSSSSAGDFGDTLSRDIGAAMRASLLSQNTLPELPNDPIVAASSDDDNDDARTSGPVIPEPSQALLIDYYLHHQAEHSWPAPLPEQPCGLGPSRNNETWIDWLRNTPLWAGHVDEAEAQRRQDVIDAALRVQAAIEALAAANEKEHIPIMPPLHRRSSSIPMSLPSGSRQHAKFPPARASSMPILETVVQDESINPVLMRRLAISDVRSAEYHLLRKVWVMIAASTQGTSCAYDCKTLTAAQSTLISYAFMVETAELVELHSCAERLCVGWNEVLQVGALATAQGMASALASGLFSRFDLAFHDFQTALHTYESQAPERQRRERQRERASRVLASTGYKKLHHDPEDLGYITSTSRLIAATIARAVEQDWLSKQDLTDLDPRVFVAVPRLSILIGVRDAILPASWEVTSAEDMPLVVFLPKICRTMLDNGLIKAVRNMGDYEFRKLARLLAGTAWPGYFASPELETLYRKLAAAIDGDALGRKRVWSAMLSRALAKWAEERGEV